VSKLGKSRAKLTVNSGQKSRCRLTLTETKAWWQMIGEFSSQPPSFLGMNAIMASADFILLPALAAACMF
jgi:hypothetical protein